MIVLNEDRDKAIAELENFYCDMEDTLRTQGYRMVVHKDANLDDWDDFCSKITHKKLGEQSLTYIPITDMYNDQTIYSNPKANLRLRFWHDVLHWYQGLDFSYENELEVASMHVQVARNHGLSNTALTILAAETAGMTKYFKKRGKFPVNQAAFIDSCLRHGQYNACRAVH